MGECVIYIDLFFHETLHMWARIDEEHIKKKKTCLLFKHEKNNRALFNDWPTYCHTRKLVGVINQGKHR